MGTQVGRVDVGVGLHWSEGNGELHVDVYAQVGVGRLWVVYVAGTCGSAE